jgi:hypothetical protein
MLPDPDGQDPAVPARRHVLDRDRGGVDVGEALIGLPQHQHREGRRAQRHREKQVEHLVRILLHLAERDDTQQQASDLGGSVTEESARERRARRPGVRE